MLALICNQGYGVKGFKNRQKFLDNFGLNWYDHHARYFDPEVGRWWAIDPALQGASPYMAMGNNPMMYTDADGRTWGIFKAIGQAWDYAWDKGNQFAQWADEVGVPSFNVGVGMNSGGQINPMVNGQPVNSGYSDSGAVASASIDQQRSQYSSPTHTGVTGGAVYTSPAISVGPLIFNGAWSYYPGEGTFNYSLAQVTLRTWWEQSSGRVEITDSPIDYLIGAGIGKSIGKGLIRATARKGITNSIPRRLARVVPANISSKTLGAPGAIDVFVTAADDIAGMGSRQIAKRLTIPHNNSGFKVIEFKTPKWGISSPINRTDPGFVGFGRTLGGAREFTIPNQLIPNNSTISIIP